ncbi:MAG: hypothetical protein QMC33_02995, partial [Octadecabacter sp.]
RLKASTCFERRLKDFQNLLLTALYNALERPLKGLQRPLKRSLKNHPEAMEGLFKGLVKAFGRLFIKRSFERLQHALRGV